MNLHPPLTLIQRTGGLYVEGYEAPEPKATPCKPKHHGYCEDYCQGKCQESDDEIHDEWLSTKKAFKIKEEQWLNFRKAAVKIWRDSGFGTRFIFAFEKGIDISSLANRIEIVHEFDMNWFAILNPAADTTIKSVTHCPTCGCECIIGGKGETHYYVPKPKSDAVEFAEWLEDNAYQAVWSSNLKKRSYIDSELNDILINGSDQYYEKLINERGHSLDKLYQEFLNHKNK